MTTPKTGLLLINLGTPDSPTPGAVRAYLREFLSDRRVVDVLKILHGAGIARMALVTQAEGEAAP
mgnify:CR=1 FL=1